MIPVPDLLFPEPRYALDGEALNEMLELAYVGGDTGMGLERALSQPSVDGSTWNPEFFADELFLRDLSRVSAESRWKDGESGQSSLLARDPLATSL